MFTGADCAARAGAGSYADSDRYGQGNAHCIPHPLPYPDTHADGNEATHAHADPNGEPYVDTDGHPDGYAHTNGHTHVGAAALCAPHPIWGRPLGV